MAEKEEFKNRSRLADMLGTSIDVLKDETPEEKHNALPTQGLPREGRPKKGRHKGENVLEIGMPDKKFCKVHNWIFDELPKILNNKEWTVYIHLYRLSIGYQKENCRIGYKGLQKRTGLGYNTVKRAIKSLLEKGYLIDGDSNQKGTAYTITLPNEGLPNLGLPNLGRPLKGTPTSGGPDKGRDGVAKLGTPNKGLPGKNGTILGNQEGVPKPGTPREGNIKNNIKDNTTNNNRKTVNLLLSSQTVKIPEPVAVELSQKIDYELAERWLQFINDNEEKIENPSGFLRKAIEQNWSLSDEWIKDIEARRYREEKEKEEEKRLAQEQKRWEKWLAAIPEELEQEAEEFACEQLEAAEFAPRDEEAREAWIRGKKKEYLRERYEEENEI